MSGRPPCAGLWNTPMVHVDGSLTTCCLDEHMENRLGNLTDEPLTALWDGDVVNAWRLAHVEGRFSESGPLCPRCNWRSAGAYPPDKVQAWLDRKGLTPRLGPFARRGAPQAGDTPGGDGPD